MGTAASPRWLLAARVWCGVYGGAPRPLLRRGYELATLLLRTSGGDAHVVESPAARLAPPSPRCVVTTTPRKRHRAWLGCAPTGYKIC
jgi:hypothetical protein